MALVFGTLGLLPSSPTLGVAVWGTIKAITGKRDVEGVAQIPALFVFDQKYVLVGHALMSLGS